MNIHLVNDEKFIDKSIKRFEKYYPKQNIWFVVFKSNEELELKHIKNKSIVIPLINTENSIKTFLDKCSLNDNVIIHFLNEFKASLVNRVRKNVEINVYWIFYGADLYSKLYEEGKYILYDYNPNSTKRSYNIEIKLKQKIKYLKLKMNNLINNNSQSNMDKFIHEIDYFCFWNRYDYSILKENFNTKTKFKYFRYYEAIIPANNSSEPKERGSIFVNNSASSTGNHLTILRLLKKLDKNRELNKIYTPLSYGNKNVVKNVIAYGDDNLDYAFTPLLDFMEKDDYFKFLNRIEIAIFGHLRQEAGNNIFYFLANGTKLFIRKYSTIFMYLKKHGYIIFEFEKDLKSISDLQPLTLENQKINRDLVVAHFAQKEIDKTYQNLLH